MRNRIARAGLLLGIVAAGCADAVYRQDTTVVDSAGVTIVTNHAGTVESADTWSLMTEPVVEIGGGANPDIPLHQITAVQPMGEGRVAVGMNSPPAALIFQADGTLEATLGRQGDGPGEFAGVESVVPMSGDSVAVWDANRRRISVFTYEGVFGRELGLSDLAPQSPLAAASTLVPAAFTSALSVPPGTIIIFVVGVWGPGVPEAGAYRLEMPSHHIDASGATIATYGPFPGMQLYKSDIGEIPFPFGTNAYAAVSGTSLVVGTAEAPEIRYYASDGTLQQVVRWTDHNRTAAGNPLVADFNGWLETQLGQRDPGEQALLRQVLSAIPQPELLPAYGGIVSGDDGQIWVGEYPGQLGLPGLSPETRSVPARQWLVFDSNGTLVATARTPEGFEPYAVRDRSVWGVFRDELDVESIRAYAVVMN